MSFYKDYENRKDHRKQYKVGQTLGSTAKKKKQKYKDAKRGKYEGDNTNY